PHSRGDRSQCLPRASEHPHTDHHRERYPLMNQRILVVIGTPLPATLNHSLAHAYVDAARVGGAEVRVIDLANDPIPAHPRSREELRAPRDERDRALDPEVERYLADVLWAEHIVFFHPQWWGTYPA